MPVIESPQDLQLVAKQSDYPLDAFLFVQRGLDFTVRSIHGELDEETEALLEGGQDVPSRHVSGAELCDGLRRFAISEYGLMARSVLRRLGVRSCEDFGRIVFAMVEAGMMHKTDEDRIEDFCGVFDFGSAFAGDLLISEA